MSQVEKAFNFNSQLKRDPVVAPAKAGLIKSKKFLAISLAFVSLGAYFVYSHFSHPNENTSNNVQVTQTTQNTVSNNKSSNDPKTSEKQTSGFNVLGIAGIVGPDKVNIALNEKLKLISDNDFNNMINYYGKVMNMYDNKLAVISQYLMQYGNEKTRWDADIPSTELKRLQAGINSHKEHITEIVNKMSGFKTKIETEQLLSNNDANYFINNVKNAKNNIFYQNSDVEQYFYAVTTGLHKDTASYFSKKNIWGNISVADVGIKSLFGTKNDNTKVNNTENNVNKQVESTNNNSKNDNAPVEKVKSMKNN